MSRPNRSPSALTLAYGGMLAALVFVATCFIRLPVSVTQGYIHLGDGVILLGAALLGWPAVPAAAIGSMLADLLAGYTVYCLPTLLIKAAVAAVGVLAVKGAKPYWLTAIIMVAAELVMVSGYFVVEWLFLGYGLAAATAAVIPNLVQGLSGVIIGVAFTPVVRRIGAQVIR